MRILCLLAALLIGGSVAQAHEAKRASFDVRHELKVVVPDGAKNLRIWFALPQESDKFQTITDLQVQSPYPHSFVTDSEGNRVLFVEVVGPKEKEFKILTTFGISRSEVLNDLAVSRTRPLTPEERSSMARYLQPNANIVIDGEVRSLAQSIVGDEKNPVLAARKLYDWTLNNIDYWVKDPKNKKASPVGSSRYCLETKTGNCTDFHSLWTALARASGIPTRMVYGAFFKLELAGIDADQSYHCWPEFYAPGIGWVPHDVAVADLFHGSFPLNDDNAKLVRLTTANGFTGEDKAMVDYLFGNLDERRVTFTWGRDLILGEKSAAGPVNALAKAHVEVDGAVGAEKTVWFRKLTYKHKN